MCAEAAGGPFSAVSRCQQRKLKMVTRQQAGKHSHTRPTLPCDPINSFNGEWSVLVTRERRKRSVRLAARRFKKKRKEKRKLNSCNYEFGDFAISFQHFSCRAVRFHLGLFRRLVERFTVARRCRLSQMLLARIKGPADPSEAFPPNAKLQFIRGKRVCSGHGIQTHSRLISS